MFISLNLMRGVEPAAAFFVAKHTLLQYYNIIMVYIQKLVKNRGQYSVTIPKGLVKCLGLDKARVVEIWEGEDDTIMIKEFYGKRDRKARSEID